MVSKNLAVATLLTWSPSRKSFGTIERGHWQLRSGGLKEFEACGPLHIVDQCIDTEHPQKSFGDTGKRSSAAQYHSVTSAGKKELKTFVVSALQSTAKIWRQKCIRIAPKCSCWKAGGSESLFRRRILSSLRSAVINAALPLDSLVQEISATSQYSSHQNTLSVLVTACNTKPIQVYATLKCTSASRVGW